MLDPHDCGFNKISALTYREPAHVKIESKIGLIEGGNSNTFGIRTGVPPAIHFNRRFVRISGKSQIVPGGKR